jgi:hypothetical protein
VLCNLSDNVHNRVAIGDTGVKAIISAMARYPNSFRLQRQACEALRKFAMHNVNKGTIIEEEGIKAIATAMSLHSRDAHIQQSSCSALAFLTIHGDDKVADDEEECVKAILLAMRQADPNIQEAGLAALNNLSDNPNNHAPMRQDEGIKIIISTILKNKDVQQILMNGCSVLQNLASHPDNHPDLRDENGIKLIVSVMSGHKDNILLGQAAYSVA